LGSCWIWNGYWTVPKLNCCGCGCGGTLSLGCSGNPKSESFMKIELRTGLRPSSGLRDEPDASPRWTSCGLLRIRALSRDVDKKSLLCFCGSVVVPCLFLMPRGFHPILPLLLPPLPVLSPTISTTNPPPSQPHKYSNLRLPPFYSHHITQGEKTPKSHQKRGIG
jgi:hypothetical protein